MFDHDRSAARGAMAAQKLIVFKHDSELGNAPAHKLFELVGVKRKDEAVPPRCFADYEVTVDADSVPGGVSMQELL
jgi:CRISPR-associated protein Csd2